MTNALTVRDMGKTGALQKVEPLLPKTPREVGEYAQFLIDAQILPDSYNSIAPPTKKQGAVIIAILKGMELGLPPLRSLQSLYVVNGKPTLYGDEIPALLWASGKVEWIKEGYEGDGDQRFAWFEAKRVNNPEPLRKTFSVANAGAMRLLGKAGPWQHSRDRMLMIRARTYCARDLFADVLAGLSIKEEQEDVLRSQGHEPAAFLSAPETVEVDPLADGAPEETVSEPVVENDPNTDKIIWGGEVIDPNDPGPLAHPENNSKAAWKDFGACLRALIEKAETPGLKLTWWELNETVLVEQSEKLAAWVKEAIPPVEEEEQAQT